METSFRNKAETLKSSVSQDDAKAHTANRVRLHVKKPGADKNPDFRSEDDSQFRETQGSADFLSNLRAAAEKVKDTIKERVDKAREDQATQGDEASRGDSQRSKLIDLFKSRVENLRKPKDESKFREDSVPKDINAAVKNPLKDRYAAKGAAHTPEIRDEYFVRQKPNQKPRSMDEAFTMVNEPEIISFSGQHHLAANGLLSVQNRQLDRQEVGGGKTRFDPRPSRKEALASTTTDRIIPDSRVPGVLRGTSMDERDSNFIVPDNNGLTDPIPSLLTRRKLLIERS
jgi:hypothetical protein